MDRIELNPAICGGKPVVQGTRITVTTVLGYLSAGDSIEAVLAAYSQLTRDDILACVEYARRLSAASPEGDLANPDFPIN